MFSSRFRYSFWGKTQPKRVFAPSSVIFRLTLSLCVVMQVCSVGAFVIEPTFDVDVRRSISSLPLASGGYFGPAPGLRRNSPARAQAADVPSRVAVKQGRPCSCDCPCGRVGTPGPMSVASLGQAWAAAFGCKTAAWCRLSTPEVLNRHQSRLFWLFNPPHSSPPVICKGLSGDRRDEHVTLLPPRRSLRPRGRRRSGDSPEEWPGPVCAASR